MDGLMISFLHTIYQVLLPISLPVIGGALLKKFKRLDTKPLSTLSLYVMSPALIFETLLQAEVSGGEVLKTVIFCLLNVLLLWLVSEGAGRFLSMSQPERSGLNLVTMFTNSVNYGLPLVLLAFGQAGLDKASVYVIVQIIIINTIGVFLAAKSHFSVKKALLSVFTLPSVYAALLAVLLRLLQVSLPDALGTGVSLLSAAYAPLALVILGAQMTGVSSEEDKPGVAKQAFVTGMLLRLLIAPFIAWGILAVLQADGLLFSVIMILSSMPAAVNAVILAEQYDAAPALVSKCILWTTLASFAVLPVWLLAL